MIYSKLDTAMVLALENTSPTAIFSVFVETVGSLAEDDREALSRLGVQRVNPDQRILTATVTLEVIEQLSELPWITRISLAKKLRPLGES